MIRSLRTGVSGLKSHQVRMDVVGNNIANANTVAFKRGRAAFGEVLGQEMLGVGRTAGGTGINPSYIGLGVAPGSIDQNWSQGSLESTGIQTDLALNGDGFFIAKAGDRQMLTRAGNFTFNRDGDFVTNNGLNVQGWAFNENGQLASGELENVRIDLNATAPAKVTENIALGGNLPADAVNTMTSEVSIDGTLDSGAAPGTVETRTVDMIDIDGSTVSVTVDFTATTTPDVWDVSYDVNGTPVSLGPITAGGAGTFTMSNVLNAGAQDVTLNLAGTDSGSGSVLSIDQNADPDEVKTISTVAYDAKGEAHTLLVDFHKIGNNEWLYQVRDAERGTLLTNKEPLTFNADGSIDPANSTMDSMMNQAFNWDIDQDGNNETMTLSFGSEDGMLTQYSSSYTATVREQDGHASGTLDGYSINPEGILELNFTNGEQQKLFQLGIGTVNNPGGLQQQGENFYITSSASGDLQLGRAGRDVSTAVVAGTLEMSNVDLATEFTDMIVAQRGYQASARIITTSDELMQETVQLKR